MSKFNPLPVPAQEVFTMTTAQIQQSAKEAVALSNSAKALYNRCKEYVAHNQVMAMNWGTVPSEALDSANGNVVLGTDALPADISNAINAMTKIIALWEGAGVDAQNYGQLFEKLANPLV